VVIFNQGKDMTFEEYLAKDVLGIITVFSARLYGAQSSKKQKLLDGVKRLWRCHDAYRLQNRSGYLLQDRYDGTGSQL